MRCRNDRCFWFFSHWIWPNKNCCCWGGHLDLHFSQLQARFWNAMKLLILTIHWKHMDCSLLSFTSTIFLTFELSLVQLVTVMLTGNVAWIATVDALSNRLPVVQTTKWGYRFLVMLKELTAIFYYRQICFLWHLRHRHMQKKIFILCLVAADGEIREP